MVRRKFRIIYFAKKSIDLEPDKAKKISYLRWWTSFGKGGKTIE